MQEAGQKELKNNVAWCQVESILHRQKGEESKPGTGSRTFLQTFLFIPLQTQLLFATFFPFPTYLPKAGRQAHIQPTWNYLYVRWRLNLLQLMLKLDKLHKDAKWVTTTHGLHRKPQKQAIKKACFLPLSLSLKKSIHKPVQNCNCQLATQADLKAALVNLKWQQITIGWHSFHRLLQSMKQVKAVAGFSF